MTGKTIVSDIIQLLEDLWQDDSPKIDRAYEKGAEEGYNEGYKDGKNAGYRDAKKEWKK